MQNKLSFALVAGLALAALTGCPPAYPKCDSDDQCSEHNEICVQGQCQECSASAGCKEGFVCESNRCVPKPECDGANPCGSGQKCRTGKCVSKESCVDDGECGAGKCRGNRCVPADSCSTNTDCPSGQECQAGSCVAPTASNKEGCSWEPLRFGFNDYQLDGEARARLSSVAECITKGGKRVTLEGHADERGTEEYNLQLSNKRASSVKKYLTDLGVKANLVDTVGFGENRPASPGHDEGAWAENRRVEFRR